MKVLFLFHVFFKDFSYFDKMSAGITNRQLYKWYESGGELVLQENVLRMVNSKNDETVKANILEKLRCFQKNLNDRLVASGR